MNFLLKWLDGNEREIKRLRDLVAQINDLEPTIQALSDTQLREKTLEFRKRIEDGATEDDLLTEAFAVVREAAKRALGLRPFDVQLMGGIVLQEGRVAEMKTGEGKTLVATLPIYLNAVSGHGAHLVTVNDYLAKRDSQWMGRVYNFLGLTVASIQHDTSYQLDLDYESEDPHFENLRPISRREAYACDVIYGTNAEFGFDYLRDNMALSADELTQRELNYALVDEVDSILIDEARTPLIISGMPSKATDLYEKVDRIVGRLEAEKDYKVEEKEKTATITEEGTHHVEEGLGIKNLADDVELMHHVNAALRARFAYKRDIDYVVKDGQVIIVDEFTGRLMFGRRYSDGLHQALEAKEHVKVEQETQTIATITIQNYFRLYKKLAGMTGTAKTEEDEFRKIYGMDVVCIPTNKPMARKDHDDVIFKSEESKFRGIVCEILATHCRKQPVLVGTRSIEVSEKVSDRLKNERLQLQAMIILLHDKLDSTKSVDSDTRKKYNTLLNSPMGDLYVAKLTPIAKALGVPADPLDPENVKNFAELLEIPKNQAELAETLKEGIPHNVLNAKYHEKEAEIIAEAGREGAVTIATNMAGRGVDIILGGRLRPGEEESQKKEADEVLKAGGLHIIGSERHESRRIDNQLRGRSGRQGDPGSSRFFVSLEDEIWRLFGDKTKNPLLASWPEHQPLEARLLSKAIERSQKKVEEYHFGIRKNVLEYDDVMNQQRQVIYDQRRMVLEGVDMKPSILSYLEDHLRTVVDHHAGPDVKPDEWDLKGLYTALGEVFAVSAYLQPEDLAGKTYDELQEFILEKGTKAYDDREEYFGSESMRDIERQVTLNVINNRWMEHLEAMDFLREGIGLRAYAQQDPLVAYKKEGFDYFDHLKQSIQDDIIQWMFRVQVMAPQPQRPAFHVVEEGDSETRTETAHKTVHHKKVGRNDPCPCGSGKKYKKCCMEKDLREQRESS